MFCPFAHTYNRKRDKSVSASLLTKWIRFSTPSLPPQNKTEKPSLHGMYPSNGRNGRVASPQAENPDADRSSIYRPAPQVPG